MLYKPQHNLPVRKFICNYHVFCYLEEFSSEVHDLCNTALQHLTKNENLLILALPVIPP